MSTSEQVRPFDPDITALVDDAVDRRGASAVEQQLQTEYGGNVDHGRVQEALAYLRHDYERQL